MRNTLPLWASILLIACTRTPRPEHPPTPIQLEQAAANGEHLFARHEATNGWNEARCEEVADAFHEARDAVRQPPPSLQLDPRLFEAHMNFAQLALSQRAYTDAADAFETARALRPRSYDASIGLGVAARALRRTDESERLYRAAIDIDDTRPDAYFNLGVLYQDHREGTVAQLQRAEEFYREFTQRARSQHVHADSLPRVLSWCPPTRRRGCRPGRAQNLHDSLVGLEVRAESARPAWTRGS